LIEDDLGGDPAVGTAENDRRRPLSDREAGAVRIRVIEGLLD
jgi:hypothetical protein